TIYRLRFASYPTPATIVNSESPVKTPASDTAPIAPPSRSQTFLRRFASSVVLWSIVIGATFCTNRFLSDALFVVLMTSIATLGLVEFYGLVEKRGLVCFTGWGILSGLLLMVSTFIYLSGDLVSGASPGKTAGILAISTTLFGLMYVPWLMNFMQKIFYYPDVRGVDVLGNYYVFY